ncbi:hypothetical protein [Streptomyces sp. NPDC058084]|uniref:hypothetical protein n=1 Tax=Streptomyces sp. NPDC058084 TaxID=3346333 RepID=UPI0036EA412A
MPTSSDITTITDLRPLAELNLLEHKVTGELDTDAVSYAAVALLNSIDSPWSALSMADRTLTNLAEGLPPGTQHLAFHLWIGETGYTACLYLRTADAMVGVRTGIGVRFLLLLAAALAQGGGGGLTARTTPDGEPDQLRGWAVQCDGLAPMTEAQTFSRYCTDQRTGEPIPPEPGTRYCDSFPLA